MVKQKALGLYYHTPFYRDESGFIHTERPYGVFVDNIAKQFKKVVIFGHEDWENELLCYSLGQRNIEFVSLGKKTNFIHRTVFANKIVGPIKNRRHHIDVMLIRGPTPLLYSIGGLFEKKKLALLIVGDYSLSIPGLDKPRWVKFLIGMWGCFNEWQLRKMSSRCMVFCNNMLLLERYKRDAKKAIPVRTTTISINDLVARDDTCKGATVNVLFVGRYEQNKGLVEILDAVKELLDENRNIVWHLIGKGGRDGHFVKKLMDKVLEYGIRDRVIDHGYVSSSQRLSELYRNADIFVIGSIHSEGFPRTIWEALAHSVPVVATKVGGIPYELNDMETGILVKPKSSRELARGIRIIMDEPDLRKQIIRNGFRLAQDSVAEKVYNKMVEEMKSYFGYSHVSQNKTYE